MPRLLKKDAVRLFEASLECINLALVGLGMPRRVPVREDSALLAPIIGLIGSAAEQAMSGCLVQAFGSQALLLESGHYKSAKAILHDCRQMIQHPIPRSLFLTTGVERPDEHRRILYEQTLRFGPLITARAGGLHAGKGPTRDVCVVLAKDVIEFLRTLSRSSRIRPYMENIPEPPEIVKDRQIILEDLARRVRDSNNGERAALLSSIFLVLPDIPTEEPEWLQVFERVSVTPREQDLSYLLDVLERSNVGSLFRVSQQGDGETVPVVVRPNDDHAIPVAPQFLRREFNTPRDQFHGDVANANGRINVGTFDVPPFEFVLELFVFGLQSEGILQEGERLTAQQSWPFIMSSLSVSGTPGPYWFLVRATNDLNQLRSYIERAAQYAPRHAHRNIPEVIEGIEAALTNTPLYTPFVTALLNDSDAAEEKRERLLEVVERTEGTIRQVSDDIKTLIKNIAEGGDHVGTALAKLVSDEFGLSSPQGKQYWARTLAEAANDEEDLKGLLAVLRDSSLSQARTAVRKAIRRIDFLSNALFIVGT
jgi:hypothetical protein